jgi:hypothetical protein
MAGFEDTLERILTLTAEKAIASLVLLGVASNINKENDTCDVTVDGGLILNEIRLRSVIDEGKNKTVTYPKENSTVLVLMMGNRKIDGCLIAVSDPEEIHISMEGQDLVANKDGFVFNNGKNGIVKVTEMVDWMAKLYADLQTLKTQLFAHPTAGNGAALGLTFDPTTPSPQITTFEDKNIKH